MNENCSRGTCALLFFVRLTCYNRYYHAGKFNGLGRSSSLNPTTISPLLSRAPVGVTAQQAIFACVVTASATHTRTHTHFVSLSLSCACRFFGAPAAPPPTLTLAASLSLPSRYLATYAANASVAAACKCVSTRRRV